MNKVAKGSVLIFISKIVEAIVAVAFSIILARLLGKDIYGLIAATLGVATVIGLFAKLGITEATAKFISQHLAKKEHQKIKSVINSAIIIELIFGSFASILCFVLAEPLAINVFHKSVLIIPLKIIAGMVFFIAIANIFTGIFLGYYKMKLFAIANICGNLVRLVTSVSLVLLGYGLIGAIFGFVLGAIFNSIVGLTLYLTMVYPSIPKPESKLQLKLPPIKPTLKRLLSFGIPLTVLGGMMIIYQWTDTLCLAAFTEVKYISWYNIAFGMVAMTMLFSQTLNTTFFPVVSELNAKKKRKTIIQAYQLLMKLLAHITNFMIIGMVALSPQIIVLLYGTEYLPAIFPFLILAVWGLIRPFGTLSAAIPIGLGKTKINAKVAIITAGCNLVFNLSLIPFYGMIGAAVATTSSYLIGTLVLLNITSKLLKININWKPILFSFISAIVAGLSMFGLITFLTFIKFTNGTFGLLLCLVVVSIFGLVIYLLGLFAFKSFTKNDISIINQLNIPMKKYLIKLIVRISR